MRDWITNRQPYFVKLLAPAVDALPLVAQDPDDSIVVSAFCDLIAEILIGALQPVEVNSPSGEIVNVQPTQIT